MSVLKVFAVAITLLLSLVSSGMTQPQDTKTIDWEGNLFHAYTLAKQHNKPLIVYFHKDYCDECRGRCLHCTPIEEMLKQPEVVALADEAIWAWQTMGIDDDHKNAKRLMDDLGVDRVPAIYVLEANDKSLKLRGKIIGIPPVKLFVKQLRSYTVNWTSNNPVVKEESDGKEPVSGKTDHDKPTLEPSIDKPGFFETLLIESRSR